MAKSEDAANYLLVDGKEISAGIILTDGSHILACLPYGRQAGHRQFDLPKGHIEKGEAPAEAAVREMREETGVHQEQEWLTDLGQYPYTPRKHLHLFASFPDALPAVDTLKCTSTFEIKGRQVPEITAYKWVPIDDLRWFFPRLEPVIAAALAKIDV